jgi:hypothetical protein
MKINATPLGVDMYMREAARFSSCCACLLLCILVSARVSAADALPWWFTNGSAEGYSIKLESASPQPGTELHGGESVEFTVRVSYALSLKDEDDIVLVLKNAENQSVGNAAGRRVHITRGQGSATLTDTFLVPRGVKEVRMHVSPAPNSAQQGGAELVLRYPVVEVPLDSDIGYPSVASALVDLRARPDVVFRKDRGWITASDEVNDTLWSFAPPGHAAYPTAVKRVVLQIHGDISIQMHVLCQATLKACAKVVRDFEALNEHIRTPLLRGKD